MLFDDSLGGAVAVLSAIDAALNWPIETLAKRIVIATTGEPRLGIHSPFT